MTDKPFVDTNMLIYAHDLDAEDLNAGQLIEGVEVRNPFGR